jgi:CheY-like chemotaxis protein
LLGATVPTSATTHGVEFVAHMKPLGSVLICGVLNRTSAAPLAARPSTSRSGPVVRPLRVLLAEDNVVNQRVAVGLLTKRGHAITVANNGVEALAALDRQAFDLVLMDLQMPEMGGLDATAAIREREKGTGQHIRIVAMTAHAMSGDRERCLATGMDGYLSKPIDPTILFATLEHDAALIGPSIQQDRPAAPNAGRSGAVHGTARRRRTTRPSLCPARPDCRRRHHRRMILKHSPSRGSQPARTS